MEAWDTLTTLEGLCSFGRREGKEKEEAKRRDCPLPQALLQSIGLIPDLGMVTSFLLLLLSLLDGLHLTSNEVEGRRHPPTTDETSRYPIPGSSTQLGQGTTCLYGEHAALLTGAPQWGLSPTTLTLSGALHRQRRE